MLSHLKMYVFLLLFALCSIFPCSIFAVETETKTKIKTENNPGPFWILNHGTDADAPGNYELKLVEAFPVGVKPIPLPIAFREQYGGDISSPFSPEYFTRKRIRIGAWNLVPKKLDTQAVQHYCDWWFRHAHRDWRGIFFPESSASFA